MEISGEAVQHAIESQLIKLEATNETKAIQDAVDTLGEISASGIPSELNYEHHKHGHKISSEADRKRYLLEVKSIMQSEGVTERNIEAWWMRSGPIPFIGIAAGYYYNWWLLAGTVALYTAIGVVAGIMIIQEEEGVARVKRKYMKKGLWPSDPQQEYWLEESQIPLTIPLEMVNAMAETSHGTEYAGTIESMRTRFLQLIWLSIKAKEEEAKLVEAIEIAEIIGRDTEPLRQHLGNLGAVQTTILAFVKGTQPGLKRLLKLLDYSGGKVEVTSENIGKAAAFVMNDIDALIGSVHSDPS